MSDYITSLGLALDIFGAILLFLFGLPPDFDPLGRRFITLEQTDEAEREKGKRYRFWGRFGLGLLIAGFFAQLVAVWI